MAAPVEASEKVSNNDVLLKRRRRIAGEEGLAPPIAEVAPEGDQLAKSCLTAPNTRAILDQGGDMDEAAQLDGAGEVSTYEGPARDTRHDKGSGLDFLMQNWLVRELLEGSILSNRDVAGYVSQNLRLPTNQGRFSDIVPNIACQLVVMLPRIHNLQDVGIKVAKAEEIAKGLKTKLFFLEEEVGELREALVAQD